MSNATSDAAEKRKATTRLEELATVMLQDGHHDEAAVRQELELLRGRFSILTDEDVERVARRLGERLNIDVDRGTVIKAGNYEPWLADRKRDFDWHRWKAYRALLLKQQRPLKVIDKLDDIQL